LANIVKLLIPRLHDEANMRQT